MLLYQMLLYFDANKISYITLGAGTESTDRFGLEKTSEWKFANGVDAQLGPEEMSAHWIRNWKIE